MRILVTGAAGFIGFHTAEALLGRGFEVAGFDNLNDYYDPALKRDRVSLLRRYPGFSFAQGSLEDMDAVRSIFSASRPQRVIHLAAQAGVRYSIVRPDVCIQSNIVGFLNILEECHRLAPEHLVFASSSSVYGVNTKLPFSERDCTDRPASLYGATKKSNEVIAHAYSHLYGLPVTGLRFFTVYGPWGRPDMAPFLFTKNILEERPIDIFNNGKHARDFTYIADIVDGILRVCDRVPAPKEAGDAPFRLYNIGNNNSVQLMDFIACIEKATGKTAIKNFLPRQPGDVIETYADIDNLAADTGFRPSTPIEAGIPQLVGWYRDYYRV
jgi:UDP-glucuronate 4-epimerase